MEVWLQTLLGTIDSIPLSTWVWVTIVGLVVAFGASMTLMVAGRKYSMNFFLSLPFWLMFGGISPIYYSTWTAYFADEAIQAKVLADRFETGLMIAAGCFVLSAILNIRKSTLLFGIVYTLGQTFVAGLSAFLLFFILTRFFIREND
jgi:hypothetical protein